LWGPVVTGDGHPGGAGKKDSWELWGVGREKPGSRNERTKPMPGVLKRINVRNAETGEGKRGKGANRPVCQKISNPGRGGGLGAPERKKQASWIEKRPK